MFRVIILLVALVAGGGAAWLAFAMQGRPAVATIAPVPPPAPMQDVLVAAGDLGPGQTLAKESMRWQSWPESAFNAAYIGRSARPDALETLVGSIVRSHMIAGEPVRDEKLVPVNTGFLASILPSGKRAVAVKISAENTAGGFVLPNDRVDVISTTSHPGKGDDEGDTVHASRTILQSVRVLAIDQSVDEKSKGERAKDEKVVKDGKVKDETVKDQKDKPKAAVIGRTATLELDAPQAMVVIAGEASGSLSLALRSALDNSEAPTIVRHEVRRPAAPPPATAVVVVLRGGAVPAAAAAAPAAASASVSAPAATANKAVEK
jgi:pilus assembly protein CpaB